MRNLFFILMALFLSLDSLASESCKTIDLNGKLGPIRNQRDKGWCFANAAADLLTYSYADELRARHFQQSSGFVDFRQVQVSSMFAALIYFESQIAAGKTDVTIFGEGGYISDSILLAQKKEFLCSQKMDEDLMERGIKDKTLSGKLEVFEKLYRLYHDFLSGRKSGANEAAELAETIRASGSVLKDYPFEELKKAMAQPTFDKAAMEILKIACKDSKTEIKRKFPIESFYTPVNEHNSVWSNSKQSMVQSFSYRKAIDSFFDSKNPKPVAIGYDVENILSSREFGEGRHASVISARKEINGVCHYQIRNSWGDVCESGSGDTAKKIYRYDCTYGSVWVPGSTMDELVKELVFIK